MTTPPPTAPGPQPPMLEVRALAKTFPGRQDPIRAVDGLTFQIQPGEIFGLLGPNGAGKSTLIKILVTLMRQDSGQVLVAGLDTATQADQVRQNIGYVQQEVALDRLISGRENLRLLAHLHHLDPAVIEGRVSDVLALVGLSERADDAVKGYSGGMKKRLDIAGGLLHRPRLLILDEPTLGLDIQTRVKIWETLRTIREQGTTVLLTTHYMEEADKLCDRVAIIDHGRIQSEGTPEALKSALGGDCVELTLAAGPPSADLVALIKGQAGIAEVQAGDLLTVWVRDGAAALPALLAHLTTAGVAVTRLTWSRPTLDEVFLRTTGRHIRDEGAAAAPQGRHGQ